MRYEKILSRDNGKKVKIVVDLFLDQTNGGLYEATVLIQEPDKRKFAPVVSMDDIFSRGLSPTDRDDLMYQAFLQHATNEEIAEAKNELWGKIKP